MSNISNNVTAGSEVLLYDDNLFWMFNYLFPFLHLGIALIVIATNVLVLAAFIKVSALRTLTNYFVVNLSVADMTFASAIVLCRVLVLEDKMSAKVTTFTCLTKYFLGLAGMTVCMFSLLWVAVERYIKLFYALRYGQILTHHRTMVVIFATWILCMIISGFVIAFHHYSPEYVCNACNVFSSVFMVYIFASILVPYTLGMFFIYGRIWYLTYQHRRRIAAEGAATSNAKVNDIKVTLMFSYIVIMVVAGYGLFLIVNMIGYQDNRGRALRYGEPIPAFAGRFVIFEGIVIAIMCSNCAINPLIYHWKSEAFRKAFRKILGCAYPKTDKGGSDMSNTNDSVSMANTVTVHV